MTLAKTRSSIWFDDFGDFVIWWCELCADFMFKSVRQELVSMTPEQKSSEPHSFIFIANQMCRECFNYGWLISCWNIDNIVKQMNLALELKLFRAEAIPGICHCLPSSSAWRLPTRHGKLKTWEMSQVSQVSIAMTCRTPTIFPYFWLGLSITQSPYKLPIRQRIAVFWRSSNSQQFGIGGNSRRSIIMSIWLYMSANSICHVCMNDYEILWMSIQCWHPWYFWICQFSDSQGLAAAEIAVVAAQPKGSLPRAHTCTNESRPWDVQSLQSFTSRIVIFIASHLKTKKTTVMVISVISVISHLVVSCHVLSFFAQVAIAKLRLSRGALDQAPWGHGKCEGLRAFLKNWHHGWHHGWHHDGWHMIVIWWHDGSLGFLMISCEARGMYEW